MTATRVEFVTGVTASARHEAQQIEHTRTRASNTRTPMSHGKPSTCRAFKSFIARQRRAGCNEHRRARTAKTSRIGVRTADTSTSWEIHTPFLRLGFCLSEEIFSTLKPAKQEHTQARRQENVNVNRGEDVGEASDEALAVKQTIKRHSPLFRPTARLCAAGIFV